jgi:hypothetical protein
MRIYMFLVIALWTVALAAQTAPAPESSLVEVNVAIPKPGMTQQWEQGRKRHSDFHRAQKDTWPVFVYEVATGDFTGNYISVQPGHSWKDYDAREAFQKLDTPDVQKNMGPYETAGPRMFYLSRPDLSYGPAPAPGGPPAKMSLVTHFYVAPDMTNEFQDGVKKVNAAIDAAKYPAKPARWYQLVNGGDVPHYVLVSDRASWEDMTPPAQTMDQALGADGAAALAQVRKASRKISTEIVVYRPDLSFVPGK